MISYVSYTLKLIYDKNNFENNFILNHKKSVACVALGWFDQ